MSGESDGWQILGASVRGASHRRKGTPNEDAWGMWRSDDGVLAMGVVADGHGDSQSLRSHVGSRLAVEAMRQVVREQREIWRGASRSRAEQLAQRSVEMVVRRWRTLVARDLMSNPLSPHEFDGEDVEHPAKVVLDPMRAYGTTLLAVVVTPRYFVLFGLGDGDLLIVGGDGSCEPVFAEDERLVANETTSLCMSTSIDEFRFQVLERGGAIRQELVLLCTDGVSNAFRHLNGFYRLGTDLLEDLYNRCARDIERDLPQWLEDFSHQGSGDDVTLCMVVAPDLRATDEEASVNEDICVRPERSLNSTHWDQETEPCSLPARHTPVQSGDSGLGDDMGSSTGLWSDMWEWVSRTWKNSKERR